MHILRKEIQFDSGHRLTKHTGKCFNLHGHRYRAEVVVGSDTLDANDMVVDFGVITEHCKTWIDVNWDHGMVLNSNDNDVIRLCLGMNLKWYTLQNQEPTAEVMAAHLFHMFNLFVKNLPGNTDDRIKLLRIGIWETPTSYAEYAPEAVAKKN